MCALFGKISMSYFKNVMRYDHNRWDENECVYVWIRWLIFIYIVVSLQPPAEIYHVKQRFLMSHRCNRDSGRKNAGWYLLEQLEGDSDYFTIILQQ